MRAYMTERDKYIRGVLSENSPSTDWKAFSAYFGRLIKYMEHERLIHLLVTLSFAFFFLASIFIMRFFGGAFPFIFFIIITAMLTAYVRHYFFMENTVQGWYRLADEIDRRAGETIKTLDLQG